MANDIIYIPVRVHVRKNGDIHKRLIRLSETSGFSVEQELEYVVRRDIAPHLRANIKRLEAEYGITD